MSDDEMMLVDEEVVPIKDKGKGKAVDTAEDNLPW
jgi:hypothetical protein